MEASSRCGVWAAGPHMHSRTQHTMAAPPAHSVLALIKAFRPTFNSPAEKVSFAAHAICTINGLKLVAIGDRANQGAHAAARFMHGHACCAHPYLPTP